MGSKRFPPGIEFFIFNGKFGVPYFYEFTKINYDKWSHGKRMREKLLILRDTVEVVHLSDTSSVLSSIR